MTRAVRYTVSDAGVSLVELIWVLAIMGVVIAIAMPSIDVSRAASDAGSLEVGSVLLTSQRNAVMRQHDVRVIFDTDEHDFIVHLDADNDGEQDEGEDTRRRALPERAVFGTASGEYVLGSTAVTFEEGDEGLPVLVYHRNGSASEEGAIHVRALGTKGAADDRAVRVERATGLSRCWSRRSGSWKEGC